MSFKFTRVDKISELPGPIKEHVRNFVSNRFTQYNILLEAIDDEDFEEVRLFCHAQLGVAASYHCYKLEEITSYIQECARQETMKPIKEILPILSKYLNDLKVESSKY